MSPEGHFEVDFRCFFFYVPVAGGISSSLKYSIDIYIYATTVYEKEPYEENICFLKKYILFQKTYILFQKTYILFQKTYVFWNVYMASFHK